MPTLSAEPFPIEIDPAHLGLVEREKILALEPDFSLRDKALGLR